MEMFMAILMDMNGIWDMNLYIYIYIYYEWDMDRSGPNCASATRVFDRSRNPNCLIGRWRYEHVRVLYIVSNHSKIIQDVYPDFINHVCFQPKYMTTEINVNHSMLQAVYLDRKHPSRISQCLIPSFGAQIESTQSSESTLPADPLIV